MLDSFVDHHLQMHLFKKQIDFNKLKCRELENKQKKSKAILKNIRKPKK